MADHQPHLPTLVPKPTVPDTETELYWVTLALTTGLGPRRGGRLVEHFGSVRAIFSASRGELEACGLSGAVAQTIVSGCAFDEAIAQQARARAFGCQIIPLEHPLYPPQLRIVLDAPLVLFAWGNVDLLHEVNLGVVGTRRPSTYGKTVAHKLARDLAALEICVVSGMARGIDTAAHRGALEAGGNTIAVFGCGVDVVYPAENKQLAQEIANSGLVLSEFPMGSPSYPQNFPLRNRVVSGISCGILVVEGAQYSGSAITARLAMEHGREVFAVPGNITSRMSWGPNLLIKQGATLVHDAADILNELPSQFRVRLYRKLHERETPQEPVSMIQSDSPPLDPPQRQVLSILRVDEGFLLDHLLDELPNMSSSELIAALFQLEMDGLVKQDVGQRYTKVWC